MSSFCLLGPFQKEYAVQHEPRRGRCLILPNCSIISCVIGVQQTKIDYSISLSDQESDELWRDLAARIWSSWWRSLRNGSYLWILSSDNKYIAIGRVLFAFEIKKNCQEHTHKMIKCYEYKKHLGRWAGVVMRLNNNFWEPEIGRAQAMVIIRWIWGGEKVELWREWSSVYLQLRLRAQLP